MAARFVSGSYAHTFHGSSFGTPAKAFALQYCVLTN